MSPFGIDPNTLAMSPGQVLQDESQRRQEAIQKEQMQRQFALAQQRMAAQQREAEMQRAAQSQQYESQQAIAAARIGQQEEDRALKEKMFREAMEAERTGTATKFTRDVYLRALSEGFMPEAESPSMFPGTEGQPSLVAPPPKEPTKPTSHREWELAGGEEGTGMSYADWVTRKKGLTTTQQLTRLGQATKAKEKLIKEVEAPLKPPLVKMTTKQSQQVRTTLGLESNVSDATVDVTIKNSLRDAIKTGSKEELDWIRKVLETDLELPIHEVERYMRHAIGLTGKIRPLREDIGIFRTEQERIRGF